MAKQEGIYEIRIKGHLDEQWVSWFEGFTITHGFGQGGAPVTTLSGAVADQAALHGLLRKVRDLGLTLLALSSSEPMTIRTNTPNLLDNPPSD